MTVAWEDVAADPRFQEADTKRKELFALRWFENVRKDTRFQEADIDKKSVYAKRAIGKINVYFPPESKFFYNEKKFYIAPSEGIRKDIKRPPIVKGITDPALFALQKAETIGPGRPVGLFKGTLMALEQGKVDIENQAESLMSQLGMFGMKPFGRIPREARQPEAVRGSLNDYWFEAVKTVTGIAPFIAAGPYGVPAIGVTSFLGKTTQALEEEEPAGKAITAGVVKGALDAALLKIPYSRFRNPATGLGAKVIKTLEGGVTFPVVTAAMDAADMAVDRGILNRDISLGEALERIEETLKRGVGPGLLLGAIGSVMKRPGGREELARRIVDEMERQKLSGKFQEVFPVSPEIEAKIKPGPIEGITPPVVEPVSPVEPARPPVEEIRRPEAPTVEVARPAPRPVEVKPVPEGASKIEPPGGSAQAVTPSGLRVETKYAVVSAKELVTSHTNELEVNPAFPEGLQPRERGRAASAEQIAAIEKSIQPELLTESPKADSGAPIVGRDLVVESGNARSIALRRAYGKGLPTTEAYKKFITDNAARWGIDPSTVAGIADPILVRVRVSEVDRAQFAREANVSDVARMSATEQAQTDAARLPDSALAVLAVPESGDINATSNREFVREFMRTVPQAEQGGLIDREGNLSQEGIRRIRNAVFFKAYGDPALLERIAESTDNDIRNISNGLLRVAPEVAKVRGLQIKGALRDVEFVAPLMEAIRLVERAKASGQTVSGELAQGTLFGASISPEGRAVAEFMDAYKRSGNKIALFVNGISDSIKSLGHPKQLGLLGTQEVRLADIIEAVRTRFDEGPGAPGVPETPGLFAQSERRPEARPTPAEAVPEVRVPSGAAMAPPAGPGGLPLSSMEIPEGIELARQLTGQYPVIVKKLRGVAIGRFSYKAGAPESKIKLAAALARDPILAVKTLMHEIGHAVNFYPSLTLSQGNVLGRLVDQLHLRRNVFEGALATNKELAGELKALTRWWNPFPPGEVPKKFIKYRDSPRELYAEALSVLLSNPMELRSRAPKFYEEFFRQIDRKPEFRDAYEKYQNAVWGGEIYSNRVTRLREGFQTMRNLRAAKEALRVKTGELKKDLLHGLIDVQGAVLSEVRKVEREIDPTKNPRYALEDLTYTGGENEAYALATAVTFKEAKRAGLSIDDFNEYAFHNRIIKERGALFNPLGWTPETSGKRLAEMKQTFGDETYAKMEKAFSDYWNVRKSFFVEKAVTEKMYGKELTAKLIANDAYARFTTVESLENAFGKGVAGHIHAQIGTVKPVGGVLEETILQDMTLIRSINRNFASRSVVNFFNRYQPDAIEKAKTKWNGKYQEPVEPRDPEKGMVIYLEEGKVKAFYVDRYVADALHAGGADLLKNYPRLRRAINLSAAPFRLAYITWNVGWQVANPFRDFFAAVALVPKAQAYNRFTLDYFKAYSPAFRSIFGVPDKLVMDTLKRKMLISSVEFKGLDAYDFDTERLLTQVGFREKTWKQHLNLVNHIENVGKALERVPKFASKAFLERTFPDMAPQEIAHLVRIAGSPAFLRRGAWHSITNNIFMFSNAMKEGIRAHSEMAFDRNPREYWAKTIGYVAVPKMLMYAATLGLLGKWWKDRMDAMSEYMKSNYDIIPLGTTPSGKTISLSIPKDQQGRFLGGLLWKTLNIRKGQDASDFLGYAAGEIPSLNPTLKITSDIVQYAEGINPIDQWTKQPAVDEITFTAGGNKARKAFLQHLWNRNGGASFYKFKGENREEVQSELEKVLGYPIVGTALSRFIRVSEAGVREEIRGEKQILRQAEAAEIVAVRKAFQKIIDKTPLSPEDEIVLSKHPDLMSNYAIKDVARKYGSVFIEEYLTARNDAERAAVLRVYMKKQEQ